MAGAKTAQPGDLLDDLDGERPAAPFTVLAAGRVVEFAPAAGPGWRELMEALVWPPAFVATFGPSGRRDLAAVDGLSVGQMRALLRGWRIHHGLSTRDADHLRLAAMLSKPAYRDAAEQDLWEIHKLDLSTEWQDRRWRRLLNLLEGLRRTSHVQEAMTLDEDLARIYVEQERRGKAEESKPRRRMSEFTVEAELLSYAVDRLGELITVHASGRGAKRRRVQPMPRPESAITKIREQRSQHKHKFTVARVFGYIDQHGKPTGKNPAQEGLALPL